MLCGQKAQFFLLILKMSHIITSGLEVQGYKHGICGSVDIKFSRH